MSRKLRGFRDPSGLCARLWSQKYRKRALCLCIENSRSWPSGRDRFADWVGQPVRTLFRPPPGLHKLSRRANALLFAGFVRGVFAGPVTGTSRGIQQRSRLLNRNTDRGRVPFLTSD
ncbi:hypothetical protein J2S34_003559 [Nitrobacter winogradskyi]|uniref:Uncharacterized protein n=1 Tax=Nitrobacter winogradskyi TaxID=913 RepID=A0ACC6AN56_NITWI|nr:hypothetical protein [Nitrobacter winogradskyi]